MLPKQIKTAKNTEKKENKKRNEAELAASKAGYPNSLTDKHLTKSRLLDFTLESHSQQEPSVFFSSSPSQILNPDSSSLASSSFTESEKC